MSHNDYPSSHEEEPLATDVQLEGLVNQIGLAVDTGEASYFENDEAEATGMLLPSRQGSEVIDLTPVAAEVLKITPYDEVNIGFTSATVTGGSSALVEVAHPSGENYSQYTAEKIPDSSGGHTFKGTYYNTSMDKRETDLPDDMNDYEKFPFKHEGILGLEVMAYSPDDQGKTMDEIEAEHKEDKPPTSLEGEVREGYERLFDAAKGDPLSAGQADALALVVAALTHIHPLRPEA